MCYHVKKGKKTLKKHQSWPAVYQGKKRLEIKINVLENQKAVWLMFCCLRVEFLVSPTV